MKKISMQLLNQIAKVIYDKKGENILAMDVSEVSSLTDILLIADGSVERHVSALAEAVMDVLKRKGQTATYIEGLSTGDWVVLDYLQIVVHLFVPKLRDRYRLEELWKEGK